MKPLSAEVLESLGFEIVTINKANYEIEAISRDFDVVKYKDEQYFHVCFNRGDDNQIMLKGFEYEHEIQSLISALNPQKKG